MTIKVTEHSDGRRTFEADLGNLPPGRAAKYLNSIREELGYPVPSTKKKTFLNRIADSWLGSYF